MKSPPQAVKGKQTSKTLAPELKVFLHSIELS